MKKIVIFGATGNIGAYFTDYCKTHLESSDYEVVAVGRKKTSFFKEQNISYIQLDLCNSADFDKLPLEDIYAVVNLAGLLPAYVKEYNPFAYIDTNITGGMRVLEYARKTGADRFLYTQTWSEQGGYWGERDVLSPDLPRKMIYTGDHAFYAITKTMMCETMEHYKQEYGLKNFVFRLPNVYLYHPELFYYVDGIKRPIGYRTMIENACAGKTMELWGDPDAFKDILYVKDLCQLMYRALFANVDGGTYNAGTGIRTTMREQIEGIIQVFSNHPQDVKLIEKPEGTFFTSFVMDISNAKKELGYEPEYTYIKYLEDYKREREQKRFNKLWAKE